jgi:hypothetical protein
MNEQRDDAETLHPEHEESLGLDDVNVKASHVEIPDTVQIQRARAALRAAPGYLTSSYLDDLVRRKAGVATEVRRVLVAEEVARRANLRGKTANEGIDGRSAPHPRKTGLTRDTKILLLIVLVVASGIAAWFYHSQEVKRRAAEVSEAREESAKSVVNKIRASWNADDDWEETLSSQGAAYTIEVEKALIKARPDIFFGTVDDVRSSGESDKSIVLIDSEGRSYPSKVRLRLSLASASGPTDAFLRKGTQDFETFVFAATITSVEKVETPATGSDEGQDYSLRTGF